MHDKIIHDRVVPTISCSLNRLFLIFIFILLYSTQYVSNESCPTDTWMQLYHQLYLFYPLQTLNAWIGNEISRQNSAFSVSAVLYFNLVRYGAVRCIHLVTPGAVSAWYFCVYAHSMQMSWRQMLRVALYRRNCWRAFCQLKYYFYYY